MGIRKEGEAMKAYDIISEWNELVFRNLTPEEKKEYANSDCSYVVENLPDYGEEVLVTNGKNVWVDSFDEDDYVYLSGTDGEIDGVTAWMPLPNPYKGE